MDIEKDKVVKQIKEKIKKGVKPLQTKDKKYFSKIRTAIKKQK
jgi:hypothetical protein